MSSDLTFSASTLWFEIPPTEREQIWQQSQALAAASDRWNAYLNRLCLQTFLPYLREERQLTAQIHPHANALLSVWSLVGGTALTLSHPTSSQAAEKLVLLPTETIDLDEFRVPQEWVDLPAWVADYYVVVQVEPEEGWLQVYGYTTHQRLKAQARYDASDRTYCLNGDDWIRDLNVLWMAREFCAVEPTRSEISDLPALPLPQANNLIARLGNPELRVPRLEVPFPLWGALMEHGGWRQQLYEQRQGLAESRSVLQWLQTGISNLAQTWGWERVELRPSAVGARGDEASEAVSVLSRQLTIAGQPYELQIVPRGPEEERTWRFELRHALPAGVIPGGFKLKLLTEDLQPFEGNQDVATTAVDCLFVEVALEPGEGIVWEVEPLPEGYDREILRF